MNKIIAAALLCICLAGLGACTVSGMEPPSGQGELVASDGFINFYSVQDRETGVWYIYNGNTITPRYNADGTLYVTEYSE